ncbi:DHH family phosphoesterase [Candidatus Thorarchaeota archaeon]|nr:MAG: DHH family phosphoesterase [Candidatus Thorarchaeota archaeon]
MLEIPSSMNNKIEQAIEAINQSGKVLAISHIDTDGITAMAIIVQFLQRAGKEYLWKNIHQLNSESILTVLELAESEKPDTIIFTDLGTGQYPLIESSLTDLPFVRSIIILDHHLPGDRELPSRNDRRAEIIEVNPCQHGLSGSSDISGAGVAFLLAYFYESENIDLIELAIVGATGDLQRYYGRGFRGLNKQILDLGRDARFISVDKDLTFFGINTRPLPYLLCYATDPYLPGITGNEESCFSFYSDLNIDIKSDDRYRVWIDLVNGEKKKVIQKLVAHILETYENPAIAKGIVGDVVNLLSRPERSELRTAKEFSTMLNACGRNRRADVGVKVCLGEPEAIIEGRNLLRQHRANLASALRRIETNGYDEKPGMYIVDDPETQDTIIGIVIGMAQGSKIIPWEKPVIGVSTNTTNKTTLVKISGRARKNLVTIGINLKEVFTSVGKDINEREGRTVIEAGGHPMAAGAFVENGFLDEFLRLSSNKMDSILNSS